MVPRYALIGCLLLVAVLQSGDRVSVKSPGSFARAGDDWWILVTVEPNAQNRLLVVEADGGTYIREDREIDGGSPRIRQVWFRSLGAGCYSFIATVVDSDRRVYRAVAARPLAVLGRSTEGNPCED